MEWSVGKPSRECGKSLATSLQSTKETEPLLFRETARMLRDHYQLEFAAWADVGPAVDDPERLEELAVQGYTLDYGADARRVVINARKRPDRYIWLAVHRRDR